MSARVDFRATQADLESRRLLDALIAVLVEELNQLRGRTGSPNLPPVTQTDLLDKIKGKLRGGV